jgi:hypothetical protein
MRGDGLLRLVSALALDMIRSLTFRPNRATRTGRMDFVADLLGALPAGVTLHRCGKLMCSG